MSRPDLLIATTNPGKWREFAELLAGLPARLVSPADMHITEAVEETGQNYAANARLKAEALARRSGLVTLGDDSGLEVAALGGRPGLYSARYAGPGASDADRREKLLQELSQLPAPRPARFVCAAAVARPGGAVREFEGECLGEIAFEARGAGGFGYDPIFFVPERGATMAELPREIKNSISHRARAVQAAWAYLEAVLAEGKT